MNDNDIVVARSVGFPMSVWKKIDNKVYADRHKNRSQYLLSLVLRDLDTIQDTPQDTQQPQAPIVPDNEQDTKPDDNVEAVKTDFARIFGDIDL